MLPTPDTSHVSFDNVYEPAEDSFLLLDTLASSHETAFLKDRFSTSPAAQNGSSKSRDASSTSPLVLEVGPGSGVILAFIATNAATLLGRHDVLTMGIDVNEFACKATAETVATNTASVPGASSALFLDCINGSLTACVRRYAVDVLVFNPPYVPSEELPTIPFGEGNRENTQSESALFERNNNLLALATDGGLDGIQTTWQLLEELPLVLSERGVAYVLLCAQNRPENVKAWIKDWNTAGETETWAVETVGSSGKTGGWEKLQVIRISRLPR